MWAPWRTKMKNYRETILAYYLLVFTRTDFAATSVIRSSIILLLPMLYCRCIISNLSHQNYFTSKTEESKGSFYTKSFPCKSNAICAEKACFLLPLPLDTQLCLWLSTSYFTGPLHSMIPLLRNIKIPFHTTNGPEKTIPPPKKQRIYPISADGAVWEQSNQTISISSLLQLATYLNQHLTVLQAPELQFFTLLRAFWHHGGWSSCRHTVQQYRDRKCKSKIKSAFTLLYRLQLLVFVYSATWARWKKRSQHELLKGNLSAKKWVALHS